MASTDQKTVVWILTPTFLSNLLLPSSGWLQKSTWNYR